jgi:hypothetical protein
MQAELCVLCQCVKLLFISGVERKTILTAARESRLQELGLVLPGLPEPGGNYVAAKTVGNMV